MRSLARRRRRGGDEGVALVMALGITMLVGVLMLVLVAYALVETRQTGRDRQRSSAVSVAEGRIDTTLARMQGAVITALPCGATTVTSGVGADTLTTVTTVRYFNGATPVTACPLAAGAVVTQAAVAATTTSNAIAGQRSARRTMETLVNLRPLPGGLDMAIYGHQGVIMRNQGDIYGSSPGVPDGDIYTNGNFECYNNGDYRGSIYAQGTVTMLGNCNVSADVHAGLGVTGDSPQITIGGDVIVSDGVAAAPHGNVQFKNGAAVAGVVRASGTIGGIGGGTWNGCATTGKCYPNSFSAPPPEPVPFPQFRWDAATQALWAAQGYTSIVNKNDCAVVGNSNSPGKWLLDEAKLITVPTVLVTPCKVHITTSAGNIQLNNNVLVIAQGGVLLENTINIASTNATKRLLYLMQPYDAVATHPCTADGIMLKNQVTIEATVNDLLYSPCTIKKFNLTSSFGQIYAGGMAIFENRLELRFSPLPVYGMSGAVPSAYALDITYKREGL